MKQNIITIPEIKLVGLKVRTNNMAEFNPESTKIMPTVQTYFQNFATKSPNITNPGKFYSVYFEYESDHTGDYSYFFGEEVSDFSNVLEGLETYTVPTQTYSMFTTEYGPMPDVVINAWQEIWTMNDQNLKGKRNYKADLEIYDQRAQDPTKTQVDVLIGIEH